MIGIWQYLLCIDTAYATITRFAHLKNRAASLLHQIDKMCIFRQECTKRLCPYRHSAKELDKKCDNEVQIDNEHIKENDGHDITVDKYATFVTSTPQKRLSQQPLLGSS